eukprot:TRINITY_DN65577_c0_g1_i1.p1 TRINITY_DN65577_c0_g1~~TRINITY_DN65577_c0_g1_i1.p1  ORF type:complete len:523 (+),score=152.32 TRINITY_DN65577_c0_g1_i1:67-1635(+)
MAAVKEAEQTPEDIQSAEQTPEDLPNVPCHIFLPVVPAARVIGKGGASIRAIREQSGASVKILQKELPQEMQRREDRVVVITGEPGSVREALGAVLERVFDRSGLPDKVDQSFRERAHIVEVLVPEKSGSHLIGQKGERIRSLSEETNCDLHVVKDPVSGLADQKRVRVTAGTVDEAAGAVWRLQEFLGELVAGGVLKLKEHFELRQGFSSAGLASFSSSLAEPRRGNREKEVPIRLLVAKDEAAWVVGKRGNKIMRLRDLAKVNMTDADSPPFDPTERLVEISAASLENRLRVVQMVVEDLALRQEASDELRILVPTEQFGSVMGHRGETLRSIIQSTKAQVQQHKAEQLEDGQEYHFRLVEIRGDESQRVEVVKLIYFALENKNRDSVMTGSGGLASLDSSFSRESGSYPSSGGSSGLPGSMSGLGAGLAGALASAGAGAMGRSGGSGSEMGQLTLQLAMPNEEVAKMLASDSSGIAWRAGVKLAAGRGAGGLPVLKVAGTAVGNSVACYLIQDRLFMMH